MGRPVAGRVAVEAPVPDDPDLRIGALGVAGLAHCPDWRGRGLAREALLTTPALWLGDAAGGGALRAPR